MLVYANPSLDDQAEGESARSSLNHRSYGAASAVYSFALSRRWHLANVHQPCKREDGDNTPSGETVTFGMGAYSGNGLRIVFNSTSDLQEYTISTRFSDTDRCVRSELSHL
jgi:hypothetical protein